MTVLVIFHHKINFFSILLHPYKNLMHYNFWTKMVNSGHCAPLQNFSFFFVILMILLRIT